MTKHDKIRLLKEALEWLKKRHGEGIYIDGICVALGVFGPEDVDITLPEHKYGRNGKGGTYCWPLTAKGAAIRRRVLKNAIKRLEK